MLLCLYYGQSNVGNAGGARPQFAENLIPANFVKFGPKNSWAQDYGERPANRLAALASGEGDIFPYEDPGHGCFPLTFTGVTYAAGLTRQNKPLDFIIGHTSWWGGEPIDQFMRGTVQYDNVIGAATIAAKVARRRSESLDVVIFWCHGENSCADYLDKLVTLSENLVEDIKIAATLSTLPAFVVQQTSSGSTQNRIQVSTQAQYLFVKRNVNYIYSSGPMYDCSLADNVHCTAQGRMIQGARNAHTLDAIMRGLKPTGLRPERLQRTAENQIQIDWLLPPDASKISWSDWVVSTPQNGFEILSNDGQRLAIDKLTISGDSTLVLESASLPLSGPLIVRSGMQINAEKSAPDGWSQGRTTLEARTTYTNPFAELGYQTPGYVAYPAMRFEETVP